MTDAAASPGSPLPGTLAALLLATDPGLGGAMLRGPPGPIRDAWVALLRALLPPAAPVRRLPPGTTDDALLGGLDLAATLALGRPVLGAGLLTGADGGMLVLPMAERLPPATAAHLMAALDSGSVHVQRDGVDAIHPARLIAVALDEGTEPDERPPAGLVDRLAFHLSTDDALTDGQDGAGQVVQARARLPCVQIDDPVLAGLCGASLALGIDSLRAPLLALRAARAAAALAGRDRVTEEDAALAARLVLAPRATRLPASAEDQPAPPPEPTPEPGAEQAEPTDVQRLEDVVLQAAQAAIPPDLLALLQAGGAKRSRASHGKAGALRAAPDRGRPVGTRSGDPRRGRLALLATLRAAAPWQRLRRAAPGRLAVRRGDFRIRRLRHRTGTTAIFAVDASGSAALNRLAEAKGAVELLLADCYVRRDQVALVAFRGAGAEVLLPPTPSLVRAKRALAALPGGGGTPLASGLEAAWTLADAVRRRGRTPLVVLLTDGRANLARDGSAGRPRAEAEALAAADRFRADGIPGLVVDIAPRPAAFAATLAQRLGGRLLRLPQADAAALSRAVRDAAE